MKRMTGVEAAVKLNKFMESATATETQTDDGKTLACVCKDGKRTMYGFVNYAEDDGAIGCKADRKWFTEVCARMAGGESFDSAMQRV